MCVHVSEWHIAAVFRSMAIGIVANAGNRLPEQRRVVQHVPQHGTLCVHISWVRFPVRAKLFLLCPASRPPLGLTVPISVVTAVLLPVIRPAMVTSCVRAVLCVLACCLCEHNGSCTLQFQ